MTLFTLCPLHVCPTINPLLFLMPFDCFFWLSLDSRGFFTVWKGSEELEEVRGISIHPLTSLNHHNMSKVIQKVQKREQYCVPEKIEG